MASHAVRNEPPPYFVLHNDHGGPTDCVGLILPDDTGDEVALACTECGGSIGTSPTLDEANGTLLRMALSEAVCTETCPECGKPNVFPGVPAVTFYTCRHCDTGTEVTHII